MPIKIAKLITKLNKINEQNKVSDNPILCDSCAESCYLPKEKKRRRCADYLKRKGK